MGLVDYGGSDSDSDTEANPPVQKEQKKPPVKTVPATDLPIGFLDEEAPFSEASGNVLNLPSASEKLQKSVIIEEPELEGTVKPRDWEQQLAEKMRKKLEKKAKKKAEKEEKRKADKGDKNQAEKMKKPVVKAKIAAFGALGSIGADSDSDEEKVTKVETPRPSTSSSKSALLSILPAPKTKNKPANIFGQSSSSSSLLLPSTLRKNGPSNVPKTREVAAAPAPKRKVDSDDSDDDDTTDFFGLNSAHVAKAPRVDLEPEIPLMAAGTGFESFGPSIPTADEQMHPSQMYNYAEVDQSQLPQQKAGYISDEQAYNLISRDDTVQVNDRRTLNEITAGIIDVSVDQALGSNVQSSLLKSITKAAYIRDINALPTKSGSVEKVARQKHQITYLAKLAVAREAALEEQWAANKSQKRMGRQKYGF